MILTDRDRVKDAPSATAGPVNGVCNSCGEIRRFELISSGRMSKLAPALALISTCGESAKVVIVSVWSMFRRSTTLADIEFDTERQHPNRPIRILSSCRFRGAPAKGGMPVTAGFATNWR